MFLPNYLACLMIKIFYMYLRSSTLKQDNKVNYLEGQVCT